ncbi:hypothetical protein LUX29_13635 [Aureimonas altamirensis]|uniref:hypothetical protein n=1 Tax=Aureimonas altamirensis TaxID=370622 RepID=UPI001E2B025A|nr:hypothetical protein [Aureimonas altamirensis]UHD44104.1 hypothetical protein LUX29_13635 [Aureimonas altamirensis]
MRRRKTLKAITAIPAALMMVLPWNVAAAQNPVQRQEQTQRGRYADGTYTAKGQYGGQPSFVVVTVTLRDGIVTAARVDPQATVPRSLEFQRRFAAAVPRVVIGKPIDQIRVGKLAGSSGTPQGFNDAIVKIRQQAAM